MARLTAIRFQASDINVLEFERADGGPLPPGEAGSHIGLLLPNGLERQYSLICAAPSPRRYSIAVKRDPAGRGGSRYVHDELKVGALITIAAPRNNFPLAEDADQTILIAGGI